MRYLNRQSIFILLLGPIFLILFFALNISEHRYPANLPNDLEDADTLFLKTPQDLDQPTGYLIRPWTKYRRDTAMQLTLDQILPELQDFVPKSSLNYHPDHVECVWRYLVAKSDQKAGTWYYATAAQHTQYFYRINDGPWQKGKVGTHEPQTDRVFPFLYTPLIRIQIPENSTLQLITKSSRWSAGSLGNDQLWRLDQTLTNASFIYQFHLARLWVYIPVLAILLSVLLYHLVLFLFNRHMTYLWLSLSALVYVFLLLLDSDLLIRVLNLNNLGVFRDYVFGIPYACLIIVVPLSISYLKIPKQSTIWYILICTSIIYIAFWIIAIAMYHTVDPYPTLEMFWISVRLMGIMNLLILVIILQQMLHRNRFAITFFAGYGTILAGFIGQVLMSLGYVLIQNQYLPCAAGFLFFSIGLAQNYRTIQEDQFDAEQQRSLLEHKHDMEMLEKKRLKELNKYKSKLYTNFTHEFRTPLTVIKGITDNIRGHNKEKELIHRNAETLLGLVNSMLDLNKLDAGQLQPNWTQTDIIPFIRYLGESIEYLTKVKNIDFKIASLTESLWMDTDLYFLETIIRNLLQNAIKFTPKNGKINIRIIQESDPDICQIRISDSGRGIPPEKIEHIFDRFYQTDKEKTNIEGGTGIGLAIVKELTSLLNGTITVHSEIYEGSTFTLEFPITQNSPVHTWHRKGSRSSSPMEKQDSVSYDGSKHQILIVEDSPDIRTYLEMLLSNDFHIQSAWNGKEGFNKAIHEIPDIIISDIMMPEMDGIEFCQMVKNDKRTSHIPVIILTAKSTQDDRLAGLHEGADAYLVKPFDKRELLIRINKLLENQQKIRKHYQQFGTLPVEKNIENKFVRAIHEHISTNLHSETYQIEDLVTHLHLSRTQIYRKLKALTGRTFTEILKDQRMARAQQLLRSSGQNISEIAFEVGYREPAYFSKVFKSETKLTPLQFRRRNINRQRKDT